MNTVEEILAVANKMMGENQYPVVTFDIDIEESDYDTEMGVIRLGTQVKGDYRDYAIIAEEVCHAEQDKDGYWAMRLAKWGIFSRVFQYLVERDAKERARKLLQDKNVFWTYNAPIEYDHVDEYYAKTLLKYRKGIFGL